MFANWRGIVAPPGISADETKQYVDLVTKMHGTERGRRRSPDQGWTDSFQTGDDSSRS